METFKETKDIYSKIFKLLNKHKSNIVFDIDDLKYKSDIHLFELELKEVYGLNLQSGTINNLLWNRFDEFKTIAYFGKKYNRTISWPSRGKQPKDELLFSLSFPTGPYIFAFGSLFDLDKDYPVDFFAKFFNELLSFNPDWIDFHNQSVYWKIKNAKKIFNSFDEILKKYYALNKEDIKQRKIKKMKLDLEKLETL